MIMRAVTMRPIASREDSALALSLFVRSLSDDAHLAEIFPALCAEFEPKAKAFLMRR